MNESQKKKRNLRQTKKWKALRHKMNVNQKGIDVITRKKLIKGCNLHHLDLREANYEKMDDESRFVLLNKNTHQCIHFLYTYWIKDKDILNRIEDLLIMMEELSND